MSGDLRALADKYVALNGEIDDVRREMFACLTNGGGANPVRPYFSPATGRASVAPPQCGQSGEARPGGDRSHQGPAGDEGQRGSPKRPTSA
jgi:hypothetical protein